MNVELIQSTDDPEVTACKAARGDYYDGFVEDVTYDELMESVSYDESDVESVQEIYDVHHPREGAEALVASYDGRVVANDEHPDLMDVETLYRQYALLERLFRRGHWGPFEHPSITLGVEGVSRSCMAQITRHRHASFDVQSQRYVDFSEKFNPIEVPKSLRDADHFSRETGSTDLTDDELDQLEEKYRRHVNNSVSLYETMVDSGVPKEDARFVLPIGTKVNFTFSVNARMLLHIEDMRNKADAQWEIREMTQMVHDEFEDWMPMTAHLYEEHGPHKLAP